MFETGIEYKQIENRDREKIISFVFETQRERLRKGWMMV
jgi:c-di-GMP-binding flagellar brake protein YcgR